METAAGNVPGTGDQGLGPTAELATSWSWWFSTLSAEKSGKDGARGFWDLLLHGGWCGRVGLRGWLRRSRWRAGFGGRGEDEAFADKCEALLGEFGLEELVFRAGEKVGFGAGDRGYKMVDGDGLAV